MITRSDVKVISDSGQSNHRSERSDAGAHRDRAPVGRRLVGIDLDVVVQPAPIIARCAPDGSVLAAISATWGHHHHKKKYDNQYKTISSADSASSTIRESEIAYLSDAIAKIRTLLHHSAAMSAWMTKLLHSRVAPRPGFPHTALASPDGPGGPSHAVVCAAALRAL